MIEIKEAHLYIQGGANQALGREIIQALHPEFLAQIVPPRITQLRNYENVEGNQDQHRDQVSYHVE